MRGGIVRRALGVVAAAIALFGATSSWADDVRLHLMHGYGSNPYLELCKKLGVAVQAHQPYPRFMCADEFPLPTSDPDFRVPVWETLDPIQNKELVTQLFWREADWKGDMTPAERDAIWNRPGITKFGDDGGFVQYVPRDIVERGDISLGRARFDINFDGQIDTVYRLGLHQCRAKDPKARYGRAYTFHVVDPSDPDLVRGTQKRLARSGIGGAFWFKGRVYLISNSSGIYETIPATDPDGSLGLTPVCAFTDRPPPN